jgi:hypothetical protein
VAAEKIISAANNALSERTRKSIQKGKKESFRTDKIIGTAERRFQFFLPV